MAITRSSNMFSIIIDASSTYFHRTQDHLRSALARRKVYRKTLSELSTLSERNLKDLGISRSAIKHLASEAAYGR